MNRGYIEMSCQKRITLQISRDSTVETLFSPPKERDFRLCAKAKCGCQRLHACMLCFDWSVLNSLVQNALLSTVIERLDPALTFIQFVAVNFHKVS